MATGGTWSENELEKENTTMKTTIGNTRKNKMSPRLRHTTGKTADREALQFLAQLYHFIVCTNLSLTRIYLDVDTMPAELKEKQRVFDEIKKIRILSKRAFQTLESLT
jgi:hypothetical protein